MDNELAQNPEVPAKAVPPQPDKRKKSRGSRWLKLALILAAALFVVGAGVLYFLPSFLPTDTIRSIVNSQAGNFGLKVDFTGLGFSWDGKVVVEGVSIARLMEDGSADEPLLTVNEVRTNVAVSPLFQGKIVVNAVDVDGFAARLVREADGGLNLPDLSRFASAGGSREQNVSPERNRLLLAGAAPAAAGLPPIEIHQVNLSNGILAVDDRAADMSLEIGLDFLRIRGSGLNDPFQLAGRVLPYPGAAAKGEIPFTGRVAVLRDGALDLENGEAAFEAEIKAFAPAELVGRLGFGHILESGVVDGLVKAAYLGGKGRLAVSDLKIAGAAANLGGAGVLAIPDTTFGVNAEFDPGSGDLAFTDLSVMNDLNSLKAGGWARELYAVLDGLMPAAAVEFSGVADFARLLAYAEKLGPGLDGLPEIGGTGAYFGNASLARPAAPGGPLPAALAVDFTDGTLTARDAATGIDVEVGLAGAGLKAAGALAEDFTLNANLAFQNVPIAAAVPQIGEDAIKATVNGGVAATMAGEALALELRLRDTRADLPATPWSAPMRIVCPETSLTYDPAGDRLDVAAMSIDVNGDIKAGVRAATVTGLAAGNPQGQAELELSTLLETVKALFQPMLPEAASKAAGSLRSVARVKVEAGRAEVRVQAEAEDADVQMNLPEAQVALQTPKAGFGLLAGADLGNPAAIDVQALELNSSASVVRAMEKNGNALSGRFGAVALKLAGALDVAGMRGDFNDFSLAANGMAVVIGQGSQQIAGVESGVMRVVAATAESPLALPLDGAGDFSLPAIDAGVDNLVFYLSPGENRPERQNSEFGNIRAKFGVDGHVGGGDRQLINLRTAAVTARSFAVNSRGQADLDTGAVSAQYAGRVMPAGMGPLLSYLKLPPSLLEDASASGVLIWNGTRLDSKANVQGRLRLASGEVNPFELAHDVSAAYDAGEGALTVGIRRLDGNVKTAAGEAVVTLAAQQSTLRLARSGSQGLVDIRLNGSAAPTRQLALGVAGVLPGLRDVAELLNSTRADGVYNAWLQVRDKESSAVGVNLGGVWQGAALQINGVPHLAEAGKLSAALEGEIALADNRVTVSRLLFRSDSAVAQAEGAARVTLATDAADNITGVSNVSVDLRYIFGDLSKLPLAFPGVVPGNMGLSGRVDGTFKAGGDANDIRVTEAAARFQNVRATPNGMELTIPQGSADFDAVFSLASGTPADLSGGPYDALRLFNVRDGRASLSGAQYQGNRVETLAGSFDLDDGLLTLKSGQIRVQGADGGAITASGTVDFRRRAPAVDLQLAMRNVPMGMVNSEISQYFTIESGVISLPATENRSARVSFSGFSEDEILQTLRLDNFTFVTGPVAIDTGDLLNSELDKARGLMRQEVSESGQSRRITLQSITGSATADGRGTITIPAANPINVIGDNTGDFRVQGSVRSDHTMDLDFFITGKLENIIGFTLPNLIPNLRAGTDDQRNRFMQRLNENAGRGNYSVKLSGPLDRPDLSGIGQVALRFMTDIFAAAPSEIIGGVVNLGRDAPGAILDAAGAILNPENLTNPSNIINAPRNLGRNVGRMFGIGGSGGGE